MKKYIYKKINNKKNDFRLFTVLSLSCFNESLINNLKIYYDVLRIISFHSFFYEKSLLFLDNFFHSVYFIYM